MKKVLIIDSSASIYKSQSRKLSHYFYECLTAIIDEGQIIYRDLSQSEPPHISDKWILADQKSAGILSRHEREILQLSDKYIQELYSSDVIVLAVPMYNWSIPSTLKVYIDHVMRVNKTFAINPDKGNDRYVGLLNDKTVVLILSRGSSGYEVGERNEHMNFQSTYLKFVFGIMGLKIVHEVIVNGTSQVGIELETKIVDAKNQIRHLVTELFYEKQ